MRREANSFMLDIINKTNKETTEQENKLIRLIATFALIVFASLE